MGSDLIFVIVAVCAFIAVGGLGYVATAGGGERAAKSRVSAVAGGADQARKRKAVALDGPAQKRKQVQDSLKELEERQKAERKKSLTLRARLEQAGVGWSPTQFWIISATLGVLSALGALVAGLHILLVLAGGVIGGLGLPRWWLGMLRTRRQKKFTANFADALDIIVRGVKSGLPLNECLKIIAREGEQPVKREFEILVEGIAVGVDVEEGMRRMLRRMPLPELSFLSTVLAIQSKAGGNLAEALQNLSGVLRARKMMREKVGALSSEAKASAMIIGSLPPGVGVLVSIMSPSYMEPMIGTSLGQMMLLGGAVWMGIGILVMRGMINFKM